MGRASAAEIVARLEAIAEARQLTIREETQLIVNRKVLQRMADRAEDERVRRLTRDARTEARRIHRAEERAWLERLPDPRNRDVLDQLALMTTEQMEAVRGVILTSDDPLADVLLRIIDAELRMRWQTAHGRLRTNNRRFIDAAMGEFTVYTGRNRAAQPPAPRPHLALVR